MLCALYTLQKENFHWNINFAILLMANLLNFNFASYLIFKKFSMMAYITKIPMTKFANFYKFRELDHS